jgi:predicted phage replisome organizer
MADISWIKLKVDMFDDEKIRLIQAMPENDAVLIIWIRLLALAGKTNDNGLVYIDSDLPYTDEILATLFNRPVNIIRLALETLKKFKMIELFDGGVIGVVNWEKHQNVEGLDKVRKLNAERAKRYRERKKLSGLESSNVTVTLRHGTEEEEEKEQEKEQENRERKEPNSLLAEFVDLFISFSSKNISKRAITQVEFLKLPSFQQEQAVIGAKNYINWYKHEQPEDESGQYSVNAANFLTNMMFMDYQEAPRIKRKTLGGMI